MVDVQPKESAAYEKAAYLGPSIVENKTFPIGVKPYLGIRMFIQMGAVKIADSMLVGWEMRWHPIQNHTNIVLVQAIYQIHKILGGSVPACGREVSSRLVAPGAIKRMLHNRKKLHMGVPHLLDVFCQVGGEFSVGEPAVALFGQAHPRAQVDLVDGYRSV